MGDVAAQTDGGQAHRSQHLSNDYHVHHAVNLLQRSGEHDGQGVLDHFFGDTALGQVQPHSGTIHADSSFFVYDLMLSRNPRIDNAESKDKTWRKQR